MARISLKDLHVRFGDVALPPASPPPTLNQHGPEIRTAVRTGTADTAK